MPTKLPTTTVKFKDAKELEKLNRQARKKGLSVSNFLRSGVGLEPLKHGGSRKKSEPLKD
jgi:hypothetical protein